MMEVWLPVHDASNYAISNFGRVRSPSGRILRGSARPDGYRQFTLGRGTFKLAHIMVLEAFVGPRPIGRLGCHRDDDKSNNWLGNLYWGSPKDNAEDMVRNRRKIGLNAAAAKLTREQVLRICEQLDAGEPIKEIAHQYGVNRQLITHINTGHVWQWLTGRSSVNSRLAFHKNRARKLSSEKARELVRLRDAGLSRRALSELFGVKTQTIDQVLNGQIWSHATGIG